MAKTTATSGAEMALENPAVAEKKAAESKYGITELADAARTRFSVPPEVVTAALKAAEKSEATIVEAKQIVKDFMEREVK